MAGLGVAGQAVVSRDQGLTAAKMWAALVMLSLLLSLVWHKAGIPAGSPQTFPVNFYRHVVGDIDGRSCPSYPVCSSYARQAFAEYGWLVGSWLMLDRLIHEGGDLQSGPRIVFGDEVRLHDPLRRNSFWLHREGREE